MKRVPTVVAAAFAAVISAACGSSTAPTPKLLITITGAATYPGRDTTIGGQPLYLCFGSMLATASGGKPGQVATWGAGHFTFVITSTGQENQGTIATAADYFDDGSPTLATGDQVSGGSVPRASGPFSLYQTFYYSTPEEHLDSATYNFVCK